MKNFIALIFFFISVTCLGNQRLVVQIFENGVKEVSPYLNFSPRYELHITDEQLIDNRGSLVDAIGIPGRITLNQESWINFYRLGVDIRLLVIHELYRSQGIDDDGYSQSLPLYQEILSLDDRLKRRDRTPYCLLKVSEFTFKEKSKKIRIVGKSQPMTNGFISFPNPFAREAGENAMRKGREECLSRGYEKFVFIEGYTKIENRTQNFSTKNVTEAHYKGKCIKKVPKKRKSRVVKEERCQKANLCQETLRIFPESVEKQSILLKVEAQREESCR
ncbi:MAG: hypothetical protein NXH75_10935 [Halobacteriovoraceae bacterium]|nr:hypothetical protein [Halobacteriovoraceae bacterium]